MKFRGYLIICEDENKKYFYLLNDLNIGDLMSDKGIYESIFEDEKIHEMKENEIEKYLIKLKQKDFKIKINVSIFIFNNKPFVGKVNLI